MTRHDNIIIVCAIIQLLLVAIYTILYITAHTPGASEWALGECIKYGLCHP